VCAHTFLEFRRTSTCPFVGPSCGFIGEPQGTTRTHLVQLDTRFVVEGDVKPHHLERALHFLPFFGDLPIGRITKNEPVRYRKYRHEEHLAKQLGKHPRPLSDATINRDISVVRHLLYWAADEGFIPQNPLTRVHMARERRKRRPVISVTDEVKLSDRQTGGKGRRNARRTDPRGTRTRQTAESKGGSRSRLVNNHNPRSTLYIDGSSFLSGGSL
jgi:hypothetical protein